MVQQAVEGTSLQDSHPAMKAALSSLREIVSLQSKFSSSGGVTFQNAKALPRGGLSELPMPPMPAVVAALHRTKDHSQLNTSFIYCFRPIEDFTELCLRVYFTAGNFSQAAFIIVNAGLYYLFLECSFVAGDDATCNEYRAHAQLCQCNLETALTNLSLMLPHNYETIEALILGASYAIEASRASLAWLLNSTAVTIGQTLGFHRSPPSSSVTIEGSGKYDNRAVLFWCAYSLDKGLSVRLGYAPLIADDDITISTSTLDLMDNSWSEILHSWVSHATVQGRMYDQLYCAAALALPVSQRQARVPGLATEMRGMIVDALQMAAKARDSGHKDSTRPTRGAGEAFADECLQSAREAMEMHMLCLKMLDESSGVRGVYLHWAILYAPFVPFIVIFCHVIKWPNEADMQRLRDFIHSLQSSCATSEAITKLHQLCDVLYNVASSYIEAKAQQQTAAMGDDFDMYLSALGFAPLEHDEVLDSAAQSSEIEDWYSGNRHMMELLEQGLSQDNTSR
ncbi:hypothetical protein QQZ08_007754 [Neonectria magnoliae]|uniref:Xylanolytic transcriptional activator regulatory domain-containing protein n=1 Tax=Neonectria magnoliae TaxID=2732573 RepID=A0ABR1HYS6_9HYPO